MKLFEEMLRTGLFLILSLAFSTVKAQAPTVNITPGNDTTLCPGQILQLTANVTGTGPGTSNYNVSSIPFAPLSTAGTAVTMTDDAVAGPFNIGFTFCFFNNSYTQFYIGSNGWISFSPGQPTAYTSAPLPNPAAPVNSIMGPWQDWHPGLGGTIRYQTIGTAPNRILIVSYTNIPMFSCTANSGTFQLQLYEGTNVIESHITNKPPCVTWAGGTGTLGIQNATGTVAVTVPGYNSTQWVANNQAWRYTPFGTAAGTIQWFINGVTAGTNPNINAFVTAGSPNRQYVVRVTFGCSSLIIFDTVNVTLGNNNANFSVTSPICLGLGASTITYTGTNNASANYTWNFDGGTITNGTGGTGQGPHQVTWPTSGNKTITLTVSTTSGCAPGTQTQTVVVADQPTSTFTAISPVCANSQTSTVTYTGNAPASSTFNWNFDGGTIVSGSGAGPYTISWATAGVKNITLAVTTGTCSSNTTTQSVTVEPGPTASFTLPNQLCVNANGTFTFNGTAPAGSTYTWDFGGGAITSGTGQGPYQINWATPGLKTITLQVTSPLGCSSTVFSQNITIHAIPTTSFTLTPAVCAGSNATVTYNGSAGPGASYNWNFGSATIQSGSGQGPYQISWGASGNQSVTLNVTENGCVATTSTTQNSTVHPIPTSSFNATSGVCVGQNATVTYTGTASSSATYNWGLDGGTLASGSGQGPLQVNWPASSNRTLTLQVSENGCSSPITSVNVTIFPTPSAAFTTSGNVCPNTPVTLNYTGTGTNNAVYTWNFDGGTATPGTGSGPHNVTYVTPGNKTISLTVSENGCQSQPFTQQVLIFQIPTSNFSFISPVCENANSTLVYTGSGGPTATFTWNFSGGISSQIGTTNSYEVNWPTAGNYPVSLTVQENGCTSTLTTNSIVVNPIPTADFSASSSICLNTAATVQYTGTAPLSSSFIWDFTDGTPSTTSGPGPITVSFGTVGNHVVKLKVSSLGCTSPEQTQNIFVNPLPVVDAGIDKQSCSGVPNFLGTSALPGITYTWTPSIGLTTPNDATTQVVMSNTSSATQTYLYTLTAFDGTCSNTDNVLFSVTAQPQVSFVIPNGQCLNTNSFNFSPVGNFTNNAQFTWTFGPNANISSSDQKEPSGIVFSTIGAQNVTVQINDAGCFSNIFESPVLVYPEPTANFTPDVFEGCQPLKVGFSNFSQSLDPLVYVWNFGNGAVSGSFEPQYVYLNNGLYNVSLTVTTPFGCTSTVQYNNLINVWPVPKASFKSDKNETSIVDPVINVSSLALGATECSYTISNGVWFNTCNFQYEFPQIGLYSIIQTVENEFGCVDSISRTINVRPAFHVYIPNSFSPNYDGLNDLFMVYGEEIADFHMQIFNRFGSKVYDSYDINSGWDGTVRLSDEISPSGVYSCLIYIRNNDGEELKYHTAVVLVR